MFRINVPRNTLLKSGLAVNSINIVHDLRKRMRGPFRILKTYVKKYSMKSYRFGVSYRLHREWIIAHIECWDAQNYANIPPAVRVKDVETSTKEFIRRPRRTISACREVAWIVDISTKVRNESAHVVIASETRGRLYYVKFLVRTCNQLVANS